MLHSAACIVAYASLQWQFRGPTRRRTVCAERVAPPQIVDAMSDDSEQLSPK